MFDYFLEYLEDYYESIRKEVLLQVDHIIHDGFLALAGCELPEHNTLDPSGPPAA